MRRLLHFTGYFWSSSHTVAHALYMAMRKMCPVPVLCGLFSWTIIHHLFSFYLFYSTSTKTRLYICFISTENVVLYSLVIKYSLTQQDFWYNTSSIVVCNLAGFKSIVPSLALSVPHTSAPESPLATALCIVWIDDGDSWLWAPTGSMLLENCLLKQSHRRYKSLQTNGADRAEDCNAV